MITGLAHTALCVPNVDAAVEWYCSVLGLSVLSPPYRMEGEQIAADMGELVPSPVVIKAAILGMPDGGDRVLEVIEYPETTGRQKRRDASVVDHGFTHVGIVCSDLDDTRHMLESKGVEFLTTGIADVAGLRTTWCRDPWGNVLILLEKTKKPDAPYWRQY